MTTDPTPFDVRRHYPLPLEIKRKLPFSAEAERAILGCVLLDESVPNKIFEQVTAAGIRSRDFFVAENQKIFSAFHSMSAAKPAGALLDSIMLVDYLETSDQIETAGGAAYVASLLDSNAKPFSLSYFCETVKEKARRRESMQFFYDMEQEARNGMPLADLHTLVDQFQKDNGAKPADENPAVVIGFQTLLTMELPPLAYAIEPLLTNGGTGELYAWRGTGKSWFATYLGLEMASGAEVLFPTPKGGGHWPVNRSFRILYVYGEMHGSMIQDRAQQLALGSHRAMPKNEFFGVMSKDFQKGWRPNIATDRNRQFIYRHLKAGGYEGLILDNISTLWPECQEAEGERSAVLSNWFMDLNQEGIWVIFLHHAGKSGVQRGSSEKEDMLDFAMRLRRPDNRKKEPRMCAEVTLEKVRGECKEACWCWPFEVTLDTSDRKAVWLMRRSLDTQLQAAFRMFADGMKPGDVWPELGISRATAYNYRKRYDENTDPKYWLDRLEDDAQ